MTYKETIAAFSKEYGYPRKAVRGFFEDFTEFVQNHMVEDDPVCIKGLVTFKVKHHNRPYFDFKEMKPCDKKVHHIPVATLAPTFKSLMAYQLNEE